MSNARRFAAVNTKIRVLKSRLLDTEDYLNLIKSNNLDTQINYLRNHTQYKDELKHNDLSTDIQYIEIELKRFLVTKFKTIIKYFNDNYARLFKVLLLRFEVEDLKQILRAVVRKNKLKDNILYFKDDHLFFNSNKLINSSNVREFIDNLKGTIFYETLKQYKEDYNGDSKEDSKAIFYIEMNLDRIYYNQLFNESEKLNKEDKLLFREILGENIDLLNIEWIYRGLKFYDLLPGELFNYTLRYGKKFDYKELKSMCYSSVEDLKKYIKSTKYGFLFDESKDIDLYMEIKIQRYMLNKFYDAFRKAKFDILISIAYLHLLEYEIKDIISILEARNYGVSPLETADYLIKEIKGSDM
jgi:V/A-type H+-transporting ATPase subunit C